MSKIDEEFFKLVDEYSENLGVDEIFNLVNIIQIAKERGIHVDFSTFRLLMRSQGYKQWALFPESIPLFTASLLKGFHPKTILDPYTSGFLLSRIADLLKPEKAFGISSFISEIEIFKLLEKNKNIEWIGGSAFDILSDIKEGFDLIVCAPPIGSSVTTLFFDKSDFEDDYELKTDEGISLLVRSCQQLNDNGVGIFIVPKSFVANKSAYRIRKVLSKYKLYLDAVFLFSPAAFGSSASENAYLVVIRQIKPPKLFVGQVFGNEKQDGVLLQNYHERRAAKMPQQGALVDESNFKGLESLFFKHEIDLKVSRSGLSEHLLGDISVSINLPKLFPGSEFEEAANAIYMPRKANSDVVTSTEELTLNPEFYLQIIFDNKKAFAPYVAKLLNSRLGLKIREIWYSDLELYKMINMPSIEANLIYLPDIQVQEKVVRVNTDIKNLSAELASLQNELLEFPNKSIKIESRLRKFSQEKGWEIWLEELPFPMASILWAYLATADPKDKLDHISHFFEASIQFFVMICLSALAQDKEYYQLNQKAWNTENPKFKGWYKNASFGSWLALQSSLAKFIRELLLKEDTKDRCLSLFGNANEEFIQALASKRLLGVFQDANTYRNLWIGHRGRLSEEEAIKRVSVFEDLLSKMREVIGDSFSQVLLLSPKAGEYVDGIFEYKVKAIKGTRPEFREQMVQSIIPLDKKKLYILPELQVTPIKVLPFGKLMSSPVTAQNAFYFYSRFDTEGVRWVSYHFEKEADLTLPDAEMVSMMKELFDGENG